MLANVAAGRLDAAGALTQEWGNGKQPLVHCKRIWLSIFLQAFDGAHQA